jgi:hypothetical protein
VAPIIYQNSFYAQEPFGSQYFEYGITMETTELASDFLITKTSFYKLNHSQLTLIGVIDVEMNTNGSVMMSV